METPTLSKVTVLERFDLGGKTYAPGPARLPSDKVTKLLEKKLILAEEDLGEDERLSGSTLEAELLAVLAPHIAENGQNEGAVETLYRIMGERDELKSRLDNTNRAHADQIDELTRQQKEVVLSHLDRALAAEQNNRDLQSQIEVLQSQNSGGQITGELAFKNLSPQGENSQGTAIETPVDAKELTPIVGAKGAIALVNAGFNTREKIQSATDKELDDLDGLADKSIEKLRAEFGAAQFAVAQPNQ